MRDGFSRKERLDLSGKALTYRVILAAAGFACGLILTKNLLFSCVILFGVYLLCFVIYDLRYHMAVERFRDVPDGRDRSGWFGKYVQGGASLIY